MCTVLAIVLILPPSCSMLPRLPCLVVRLPAYTQWAGSIRTPPPRRFPALYTSKRTRALRLSPKASASTGKEVVLSAPTNSASFTLYNQKDLERALGCLGCEGGMLVDEASKVTCRFADLRDCGRYVVLPQAARQETKLKVTLLVPREDRSTGAQSFASLGQHGLECILALYGGVGFLRGDGLLSRDLADMEEGGTYTLVLAERPSLAQEVSSLSRQVSNQQGLLDNFGGSNEAELVEFLRTCAQGVNPSGSVQVLPRTPLRDGSGRDRLQLDAAVVVPRPDGNMLLLGEHKHVLDANHVADMRERLEAVRALRAGEVPELAAALAGVTEVELFLAGEDVRRGVPREGLAEYAAKNGVAVVLPSGAGLGAVMRPGPFKL